MTDAAGQGEEHDGSPSGAEASRQGGSVAPPPLPREEPAASPEAPRSEPQTFPAAEGQGAPSAGEDSRSAPQTWQGRGVPPASGPPPSWNTAPSWGPPGGQTQPPPGSGYPSWGGPGGGNHPGRVGPGTGPYGGHAPAWAVQSKGTSAWVAGLLGALGGLLVGVFLGAVLTVIGYESDSPHGEGGIGGEETDYASTYGPGGTYEAFELREEQCAEAGLLNVEAEDAVSCGQSPVVKVYYREPIPVENDEYPSEGLEGYAYELCYLVFDERTGLDYESVPEDYESLVPSREAWEDGERDIICLLLEGEGEGSDSLDALGGVS